jgi:hypothetical protein
MADQNTFDIDSLLDGTLDDLADLPEFRPFPAGTYRFNFWLEQDKKDKNIYYSRIKNLETIELTDTSEVPMEVGAEAGVRYDLSNEFAQGAFKKILAVLAGHFGAKPNRQLIEDAKSPLEVLGVIKQTTNKKNGKVYNDIVEMQVV